MDRLHYVYLYAVFLLFAVENASAQSSALHQTADSVGRKTITAFSDLTVQQGNTLVKRIAAVNPIGGDSLKNRHKVRLNQLLLESGLQRSGLTGSPSTAYQFHYGASVELSVFRLPISFTFSRNGIDRQDLNPFSGGLFQAGLDRKSFQHILAPELSRYREVKSGLFNGRNASEQLRAELMARSKKAIDQQSKSYGPLYDYFNQQGNVEALLKLDEKGVRQKLNAVLDEQENRAKSQLSTTKDQERQQIAKGREIIIDSLTTKVMDMKQLLGAYGIDAAKLGTIEQLIDNPDAARLENYLGGQLQQSPQLKNLQGLFNRLQDFRTGSFGEQLPGSFINREIFLQGASVTLRTRKGPINLGFASSRDIGMAKDEGFTHSNFNIPKLVTYVSVPIIGNGYSRGRISWTGSVEKQSYRLNESAGISPRSGSALTLSQELGSEKMGRFTLELSKSAAAFRNVGQIGSEQVLLERNTFGNYFRDDLLETMAFGVKYDMNDQKSRLNTNLFFNYSGIGFQNPAQQGFGNMGMRMGGSVRKGLFKNKVVLNLRGDLKNTPVSGTTDAHWQNHNLNVEARFKLSRKFSFSMKYMDNGVQKSGELQQSVYGSKKYQFDASSSYKLFKKNGFSHLVMGLQQMNNPVAGSNSQFLTTIYTQNLSLGSLTLMGNLFYNKELGQQHILGDMVNADAAVQYRLLEKVSASTGVTYLNNTGQAQQLGIKQNAQFTVWKNMEVNLYADLRKNMVAPLYPELFANNRAEVSLKYYFR